MNRHQSPKNPTYTARRLPVTELRPGMHVTLAKHSPTTRKLPEKVGQCVGGSYAVVTECQNFGDDLRVRVSSNGKILATARKRSTVPTCSWPSLAKKTRTPCTTCTSRA